MPLGFDPVSQLGNIKALAKIARGSEPDCREESWDISKHLGGRHWKPVEVSLSVGQLHSCEPKFVNAAPGSQRSELESQALVIWTCGPVVPSCGPVVPSVPHVPGTKL